MKSLMDVCRNFGEEACHPDISKWRLPQKIGEGEGIPIRPVKKETDKICNNCKSLSIKECLYCNSTDIKEIMGVEIKEDGSQISDLDITCENCGEEYTITKPI